MARRASRDEIRLAYRRLARQHHPDARGETSTVRMAQINEAWRVLSDPGRRAVYDAGIPDEAGRPAAAAHVPSGSGGAGAAAPRRSIPADVAPARFPWRFMLAVAAAGIAFVILNAALTKPGVEPVPDNLMEIGSCVDILDNGDAKEVICGSAHDGVVTDLRPVESGCPFGTELHRDRQGMGSLCVRMTNG